ncbi:MAG: hypothetical protein MJD61_22040 [Proteobacteria bacterium]|nr:hypothetical protein [Pseudomonadota bacterium]
MTRPLYALGAVCLLGLALPVLYGALGHDLLRGLYAQATASSQPPLQYYLARWDYELPKWSTLAVVLSLFGAGLLLAQRRLGWLPTLSALGICVLIVELLIGALLKRPALASKSSLAPSVIDVYLRMRNVIQTMRSCARFDAELFYTLRPGSCRFDNVEFDTEVSINSQGLRDDEQSLVAPEIVVVGDSHAMGWGVEQEATFSEILQRQSRRKVLNAGISSYGTYREMRILRRLDLSGLQALVIQYCENDYWENLHLYRRDGELERREEARYNAAIDSFERARRYWPIKYTFLSLRTALFPSPPRELKHMKQGVLPSQLAVFLAMTRHAPQALKGVPVAVLETCPNSTLVADLQAALSRGELEGGLRFQPLPLPELWRDPERHVYFYPLDGHLKPAGHQRVAARIGQWLAQLRRKPASELPVHDSGIQLHH